MAKFTF